MWRWMIRDVSCTFAGSGAVLGSFSHALHVSCHSIKCVRTRSLPKSAQMAVSRQGQSRAAPSHGSAYMCYSCTLAAWRGPPAAGQSSQPNETSREGFASLASWCYVFDKLMTPGWSGGGSCAEAGHTGSLFARMARHCSAAYFSTVGLANGGS